MAVPVHVFVPSERNPRICGVQVNRRQHCGVAASNRAVHAPGALPLPPPLRAVPIEAGTSAALTGQAGA